MTSTNKPVTRQSIRESILASRLSLPEKNALLTELENAKPEELPDLFCKVCKEIGPSSGAWATKRQNFSHTL